MYLASIWAINNLAAIVISVKTLGLKYLPYIAATQPLNDKKAKPFDPGCFMRLHIN